MPRTIEDLMRFAADHGWMLNPDPRVVENVLRGQNRLYERHGRYYCPCKVQKTEANICPCQDAGKEIAKKGKCHCQLFFRH